MQPDTSSSPDSLHHRLGLALKAVLFLGVVAALWERQWSTAVITLGILAITLVPLLLKHRFRITVPPTLELLAIAFVFASLFLGEVRGYYREFWWWDLMLHTLSGFLLGIVGFLLVFVLNGTSRLEGRLKPGFVAFFAFLFAVGAGALWEVLEFSLDRLMGTDLQNPMLGDPSGLTDTMWDLIVDTLGALAMSILGYGYLKTKEEDSFLERWIAAFVRSNPGLFRGRRARRKADGHAKNEAT